MTPEIETAPGHHWSIWYRLDGPMEVMSVFGVMTVEEAIAEARWSLENEEDGQAEILAVVRQDVDITPAHEGA